MTAFGFLKFAQEMSSYHAICKHSPSPGHAAADGLAAALAINFPSVTYFHHNDHELAAFDLVDHSIIAHTDSIVRLFRMELLGAGWERVFPQAINVPPQPLLDSFVKRREIALSTGGKPDGIGHGRYALEPQVVLDLLPGNQTAGLFHDMPRLFQIPTVFQRFENPQILRGDDRGDILAVAANEGALACESCAIERFSEGSACLAGTESSSHGTHPSLYKLYNLVV